MTAAHASRLLPGRFDALARVRRRAGRPPSSTAVRRRAASFGWAIADYMRTELVTDALTMALTHRRPEPGVIFHSDRGTQYTSSTFAAYCRSNNIRRSLGRTGICYDNAVAESFFASYNKELIHTRPWPGLKNLKKATFDWIENYYNRQRRHSTLGYLTPQEYELGYRDINQIAA